MATAKKDRLAALKDARARGGRLQQFKPDEFELYDQVTDEQYKSIVGTRLQHDDFIEDDDGSGYVDHGEDDWDDGEGEESERKESEDEDDFDGEDEELRKQRKAKRARQKAKMAKSKPKAAFSDYARPVASTSTYRPAPSAVQEDDFMASLLSSVSAQPASSGAKRKSSPEYPSSDPVDVPSSDSSWMEGLQRKRYGADSDEEPIFESRPVNGAAAKGKKPRVSEVTIKAEDEENWPSSMMEVDDLAVKAEPDVEDDDDLAIRSRDKPLVTSNKANGGAAAARRRAVNASSVKAQIVKPEPEVSTLKAELAPSAKPRLPASATPRIIPGAAHWTAVQEAIAAKADELDEVKAPVGNVKPEHVLESDGSLQMFWLDFMDQDGVVHLVGKALDRQSGRYVSVCLSVNGIQRNIFVQPRPTRVINGQDTGEAVTKTDVFEEFDKVRRQAGIEEWATKFVDRNYAFEDPTVPKGTSEWMKVEYGFDQPELSMGTTGATFSHMFGTNTSPFELFVIKRKIMGPCWLEIKEAQHKTAATSWCKLEFSVADPKKVAVLAEIDAPRETPPLTIMSISLRTIVNHRENKTEILCATTRTWDSCNIDDPTPPDKLPSQLNTIVRPIEKFPPGLEQRAKTERPSFQTVKAERALLNSLLATVHRYDPDVIVGHNFLGNTFEAMLYRMKELKADHWSRIGRFRRKGMNISKMGSNARLMAGRLVADLTSDQAKQTIQSTTWSLTEMCGTQLKIQREDVDPEDTHSYFDQTLSGSDRLVKFIRLCEVDAFFQMAIAHRVQMLPLTKQLTNLAGNSWNLTLNGGRAVRNEFILLHEFHRLKYVCPDKAPFTNKRRAAAADEEDAAEDAPVTKASRGKAKYAGGLVFEPKRGLWDTYILVMDFNSLYPSIIQEYNIDFTTVKREPEDEDPEEEKIPDIPEGDVAQGVLPRIIAGLVGRRRQVKALMKDKTASAMQLQQWDTRQQALKLTANSMYGCLGFQGSRFSSRPLAALTTFKGREILTHTRELAESLQLDVVYGDTDSVFVNSNVTTFPEALKIANEFKKLVNERYKLLEIDLDAVFERILLLNKKKYAAVKIDEVGEKKTEIKGLDMKRREFSKLSKDASAEVLREILSGEATEVVVGKIHDYLTKLGERVRDGQVPLDDFIIFKRLGKNPEDYPDKKSQPHVQVALRMKSKGVAVRAHDVIPYIICLGEDGKTARAAQADKAFHPDDLRRQGSELRVDYDLYLDVQVLQPILRLCDSIEGTDRSHLAECLGLDPARYSTSMGTEAAEKQYVTFESQISDKERFRDAEPLTLRCPTCTTIFTFASLLDDAPTVSARGVTCASCDAAVHPASVCVQLENQIREKISRYYAGWTVCDGDDGCGARSRMMSVHGRRCLGWEREGCKGAVRLEYSDLKLYNQLLYYASLFDLEKALGQVRGSGKYDEVRALTTANQQRFQQLEQVVEGFLDRNGRRYVDMKGLFGFMERIKI